MNKADIEFLEGGSYLSFGTRKRSGDWVATPVWFAPDGDAYYVFSAGEAGKVKRLRNFDACRIAPCTVSGTLTGGWLDSTATVLESSDDIDTALRALRRKYGWQMLAADFFSRLSGKMQRRAYIRIQRPG
ncbi:PPOX class F420-dependent oxidoreductase [Gymnodinialimonas sp.]